MDTLDAIVAREVADYAHAEGYKDTSYYLEDREKHVFSVVVVPDADHPLLKAPRVMLLVRLDEDQVLIETDTTDKPLLEELIRAGVPREKITVRLAENASTTLSNIS